MVDCEIVVCRGLGHKREGQKVRVDFMRNDAMGQSSTLAMENLALDLSLGLTLPSDVSIRLQPSILTTPPVDDLIAQNRV